MPGDSPFFGWFPRWARLPGSAHPLEFAPPARNRRSQFPFETQFQTRRMFFLHAKRCSPIFASHSTVLKSPIPAPQEPALRLIKAVSSGLRRMSPQSGWDRGSNRPEQTPPINPRARKDQSAGSIPGGTSLSTSSKTSSVIERPATEAWRKNTAQLHTLFALANLILSRRTFALSVYL